MYSKGMEHLRTPTSSENSQGLLMGGPAPTEAMAAFPSGFLSGACSCYTEAGICHRWTPVTSGVYQQPLHIIIWDCWAKVFSVQPCKSRVPSIKQSQWIC